MEKVGTVEILIQRIYPLDMAAKGHNQSGVMTEVAVEPGTYTLYDDQGVYFWMMKGKIIQNIAFRIGAGMFSLFDAPSNVEVTFPSERYDERMWAELLADPVAIEGSSSQRLRIKVLSEVTE